MFFTINAISKLRCKFFALNNAAVNFRFARIWFRAISMFIIILTKLKVLFLLRFIAKLRDLVRNNNAQFFFLNRKIDMELFRGMILGFLYTTKTISGRLNITWVLDSKHLFFQYGSQNVMNKLASCSILIASWWDLIMLRTGKHWYLW